MTRSPEFFDLEIELPPPLERALRSLEQEGATCRIVGGSVRDALLGLKPKDFDIEVYGLGLDRISEILSSLGKTDLVGKAFAVVKLWIHGEEYDFAIPRKETKSGSGHRGFTIEADASLSEWDALQRRDFTLNALLYDHRSKRIIDYCGGKRDLENRILRHISPAFSEDPLRVLRAMQFAGRFELTVYPETADLCASIRQEFWTLPQERVWGEWAKWAARSKSPRHGLQALKECGWLPFFPEVNALTGLPQDPTWHPEGDVWHHTLCCLDALVARTDWLDLPESERTLLSLSVLCHDLGKARCTRWALKRGAKHWISPGHDSDSAWLSIQFLDRMRAPHLLRDKVSRLVANHHFLNTVPEGGHSDASLRRLSKRLHPANSTELVYVMKADHYGRPPFVSVEQEKRIAQFETRITELDLKQSAPKPILQGRHLIAHGLKPGPTFKAILDSAYEAQLEGTISNLEEATSWLRSTVQSLSSVQSQS